MPDVKIAEAFEVDPGVLMGPDEVHLGTTAEQRLLLRVLDEAGIEPAAAIVRLAQRICTSALSPTTKR